MKIAIAGLGLNGLICAISMKIAGYDVTCFEETPEEVLINDERTSALTFETIEFFKDFNINEKLKPFLAPIMHIYTFEQEEKPILDFDAHSISTEPFGYVVLNSDIKKIFFEKLKELKIQIIKSPIISYETNENFINIKTTEIEEKFKLLLACTGKNNKLFKNTKKILDSNYNQTAFVFSIKHSEEHKNIAIESFTGQGPLAILPLVEKNTSGIIYTVKEETADYLKTLTEEAFFKHFVAQTERMRHIGKIESFTSKIKSYPLTLSLQKIQAFSRVLMIGDAFNAMHPVAGQSFNVSLKDIKNLYLGSKNCLKLGLDVGSLTFLKEIERKNIKHHLEMSLFTHLLVKMFSNYNPLLKFARNMGINFINHFSPLKKFLMKKASGIK